MRHLYKANLQINRLLSITLSLGMVMTHVIAIPLVHAEVLPALEPAKTLPSVAELLSADIRVQRHISELDRLVMMLGANKKVNIQLHGVPLADAFRALSQQAGFSVVVDESVVGNVNVDLKNVRIQEALETFKSYGNLSYAVRGKSLIVAKSDSDRAKAFLRTSTQIIPLHNANAKILSQILDQSVFGNTGQQSGSSTSNRSITYDFHTNSLIVTGSPNDIQTVQNHVASLDVPRETRTWRLSHANAVNVAAMLSASLFNEGTPAFTLGGSSSSSSSTGGGVNLLPSTMNVQEETIKEASQATAGDSNIAGASDAGTPLGTTVTLRARVKQDQKASVNPQGPIIIPDSRLNTITLMATAEQIALAESLIPTLDRKVPQLVLEASIIEVTEKQRRDLGHSMGVNLNGALMGSNNPGVTTTPRSGDTGIITSTVNEVIFGYTSNPIQRLRRDFMYQINLLDQQDKLKLVANPTVITAHDNETIISVVDEIIRKNELTVNSLGNLSGSEAEIGNVGVVLNILPKVGANGTISLRVRPTVSTLSQSLEDFFGGQINLISKRDTLIQNVVLKDGESFILGGLMNDTDSNLKAKIPGIGDLPIIGQLGRNNSREKKKTELIIVITPHIMNDETDMAANPSGGAMMPVNLQNPNRKDPAGNAFGPVSDNGYHRQDQSQGYLPPLEAPHALNNEAAEPSKSIQSPNRKPIYFPAAAKVSNDIKPSSEMLMLMQAQGLNRNQVEKNAEEAPLKPID